MDYIRDRHMNVAAKSGEWNILTLGSLNLLNETILTGLIAYIWYFYTFLETRRFEHFAVVRGHG